MPVNHYSGTISFTMGTPEYPILVKHEHEKHIFAYRGDDIESLRAAVNEDFNTGLIGREVASSLLIQIRLNEIYLT